MILWLGDYKKNRGGFQIVKKKVFPITVTVVLYRRVKQR